MTTETQSPLTTTDNLYDDPGTKKDEPSAADVYAIAKEHYGSIFNLMGLGGPGTYCLLGPTESGKSFLIKQLYFYATSGWVPEDRRLKFSCIFVVSTTSTITEDFTWNSSIIHVEANDEALKEIIMVRKMEMMEECKKLGKPKSYAETWAEAHPILVICDDTYGTIDFTTNGNIAAGLATKARHYGIYFILAAQYMKQLGPVFRDNARMWVCMKTNMKDHREITDDHYGKHVPLAQVARKNNYTPHNMSVYVITWRMEKHFDVQAGKLLLLPPVPDISKDLIKITNKRKKDTKGWQNLYKAALDIEEEGEGDDEPPQSQDLKRQKIDNK